MMNIPLNKQQQDKEWLETVNNLIKNIDMDKIRVADKSIRKYYSCPRWEITELLENCQKEDKTIDTSNEMEKHAWSGPSFKSNIDIYNALRDTLYREPLKLKIDSAIRNPCSGIYISEPNDVKLHSFSWALKQMKKGLWVKRLDWQNKVKGVTIIK